MEKCRKADSCIGYYRLDYPKGLLKKVIEKVSFTLLVSGQEEYIEYTIPLERKYHYSFLRSL